MIKTKSVYASKSDDDGIRVLIMRKHPQNVVFEQYDVWLNTLSPPLESLKAYKAGELSFEDLMRAMVDEITSDRKAQQQLNFLVKLALTYQTFTLLCWEPENQPCHRYLIKEMIDEHVKKFREEQQKYTAQWVQQNKKRKGGKQLNGK